MDGQLKRRRSIGTLIGILLLVTVALFASGRMQYEKGTKAGIEQRTAEEMLPNPEMTRNTVGFVSSYIFYDKHNDCSFTIQSDLNAAEVLTIVRYLYRQDANIEAIDIRVISNTQQIATNTKNNKTMSKTIRLRDKKGPGVKELDLKDIKAFANYKPERQRKMVPFDPRIDRI